MGERDVEAGVRARALHVWGAQHQHAARLQRAVERVDHPQQRVLRYVLDHMREVDEVVLLRSIRQEVANIIFDLVELNGSLAPGSNVVFVCDSEVGAREFPVPQLQAGRQKPTTSEADVEDGRVLVLRQKVSQFVVPPAALGTVSASRPTRWAAGKQRAADSFADILPSQTRAVP